MSSITGAVPSAGGISIIIGAPPAGCGAHRTADRSLASINEAVADALAEASTTHDCMSDWRCLIVPPAQLQKAKRRLRRLQEVGLAPGGDYRLVLRNNSGSNRLYFRASVMRRLGPRGPQAIASEIEMMAKGECKNEAV